MTKRDTPKIHALPNRPLYGRAADALVEYLAQQAFEPGAMLPGEDELARQLQVSRSTLREAMGMLEKEGLVVRKHGIGTFVTNPDAARFTVGLHQLIPLSELAAHAGTELEVLEREVTRVSASPELAGLLGVAPDELLLRVQTVLRLAAMCSSFYDYRVPLSRIDAEAFERSGMTVLEYCRDHGRPRIAYASSELRAMQADEALAARLRVVPGAAILHLAETMYSAADEPLMVADVYHATQELRFRIVRQVPGLSGARRSAAAGGDTSIG